MKSQPTHNPFQIPKTLDKVLFAVVNRPSGVYFLVATIYYSKLLNITWPWTNPVLEIDHHTRYWARSFVITSSWNISSYLKTEVADCFFCFYIADNRYVPLQTDFPAKSDNDSDSDPIE